MSEVDCWGRGLEVHTCEYCGKIKPVKYYADVETGDHVFTLLDEYLHADGRKLYKCIECSADIDAHT